MREYKPNATEAAWIRELAAILDDTGLTEIEIQKSDVRVRVARSAAPAVAWQPAPAGGAAPARSAPSKSPAAASKAEEAPVDAVTSPMVGTIYLSPAPGEDPFVKVGDKVSGGQTLMIVEAMKTMNPIASPKAGTVRKILVRDAQPVEFGVPLIVVD